MRSLSPAAQAAACSTSRLQTQSNLHAHVRFDPAVQLGLSVPSKHPPNMPHSASAAYPASTMCINSGQLQQQQQHSQDGCKAASGFVQAQPHRHRESQNQQKPQRRASMDPQGHKHCSESARPLPPSQAQPSASDWGQEASALSVRPRKRHKVQDHATAPVAGLVNLQQSAHVCSPPAFPQSHAQALPSALSVSAAVMLNQRPSSSSSVRATDCTQGKHATASTPAKPSPGSGNSPSSPTVSLAASAVNRRPALPQTVRIGSVHGHYQRSLQGIHTREIITKPSCTTSHEGRLNEGGMQQCAPSQLKPHADQCSNNHITKSPSLPCCNPGTSMHSGHEQPMPSASQQLHRNPGTSQAASRLALLPSERHQHAASSGHRASAQNWQSHLGFQQHVGNHDMPACSSGLPQASQTCVSQRAQADGTALGTLLEGSQRLQASAALAQVRFQSWHQH